MINEKECMKILNEGKVKFSKDEVKIIRDFIVQLATIEYEQYRTKQENLNVYERINRKKVER
jgi:hypothetical protein